MITKRLENEENFITKAITKLLMKVVCYYSTQSIVKDTSHIL